MKDNHRLSGPDFGKGIEGPLDKMPPLPPFNADLAMRVAEDTQKLTQGKISEAEYYHKYHKAYLGEFGIDARPVLQSDKPGTLFSDSLLAGHMSRRTMLKLGGVTLASLAGARLLGGRAFGAPANIGSLNSGLLLKEGDEEEAPKSKQMGMVVDLEKCDGCLSCVYACQNHNFNSPGVLWIYIFAYKDINREEPNHLVRLCQHCQNPPCVKVCPVRARHKRDKDGLVLTDYDLCIGCRYCMVTCPYGVNYFQWDEPAYQNYFHPSLHTTYATNGVMRKRWVIGNPPKGVMGKCTFCPDRQDDGRGNVVCALTCPHNVLHFGDINDPHSEPMQYLAQRTKDANGKLSTFRLLENQGTKPSIIYIGQQPTRSARVVDGPVKYSDWGLVERRMDMLKGPEPWFIKAFGGSQ